MRAGTVRDAAGMAAARGPGRAELAVAFSCAGDSVSGNVGPMNAVWKRINPPPASCHSLQGGAGEQLFKMSWRMRPPTWVALRRYWVAREAVGLGAHCTFLL